MGPGRGARSQPAEIMGPQSRAVCVSGQTPEHRVAQTHLFRFPQHAFPTTETLSIRTGVSLPVKGDGLQGGSGDQAGLSSP